MYFQKKIVFVLYYLPVKLPDFRVSSHLLSVKHILCGQQQVQLSGQVLLVKLLYL